MSKRGHQEFKQFYDEIYIDLSESSQFTSKNIWLRTKAIERSKIILESLRQIINNSVFSLIDLGCADGWILDELRKLSQDFFYVGIDIAPSNLNKAKLKETGNWVLCDAENLPFKNNIFDVLLCSEVLEHLLYPEKCLKEAGRVVRYYAVFTTPMSGSPIFLDNLRYNKLTLKKNSLFRNYFKMIGVKKTLKLFGGHINSFTVSTLRKLYLKYFEEVYIKGIAFFLPLLPFFLNLFPSIHKIHIKIQEYFFQHLLCFQILKLIGNNFALIFLKKKRINKKN